MEKPIIFTLNNNSANGVFDGYVMAPNGAKHELVQQEIDNEVTSCRFMPREHGIYWAHIIFNDNNIPDSPLSFVVGSLDADPALVRATGDGLSKGAISEGWWSVGDIILISIEFLKQNLVYKISKIESIIEKIRTSV